MSGPISAPSPISRHYYPVQPSAITQETPTTDTRAGETFENRRASAGSPNTPPFSTGDAVASILITIAETFVAFRDICKQQRQIHGASTIGSLLRGAALVLSSGIKQMIGAVVAGATQIAGSLVALKFSLGVSASGLVTKAWEGTKWLGGAIKDGAKWLGGTIKDGTKWLGGAIKEGAKNLGGMMKDAVVKAGARTIAAEVATRKTAVLPDVVRKVIKSTETMHETVTYRPAPSAADGSTASAADKDVELAVKDLAKTAAKQPLDSATRMQRDLAIANAMSPMIAAMGTTTKGVFDNEATIDQAKKAKEDAEAEEHRTARDIANSDVQAKNEQISATFSMLSEALARDYNGQLRIVG